VALLTLACNWGLPPMQMGGDAAIHYNLGQAYAKEQRITEARAEYAEAVRLDPSYWQAWLNLGSVEALSGRMEKAAEIFENVAQARPAQLEAWINLSHARLALGQGPEAQQAYAEALKLPSPHRPQIYVELMGLHLRGGAFAEAERVLMQAKGEYPQGAAQFDQAFAQMKEKVLGR
jgi:tetratricopeptide (TPR) repeat protein